MDPKQQTVAENIRQMEPTDEDLAELNAGAGQSGDRSPLDAQDRIQGGMPATSKPKGRIDAPEWAVVPGDLHFPAGKQVSFLKFEKAMTDNPSLGDRQVIIWNLTVKDERLARQRTFGDPTRVYDEMAKQMIRAIDGEVINWGNPAAVDKFWDDIGGKYRSALVNWYLRTHNFADEEKLRFFASCVAIRNAI